MAGQGALAVTAWSMASPAIVLTFLAVAMDLPIFLAGLLVSIRHAAGTLSDVFVSNHLAQLPQKKATIARTDIAVAACFLVVILTVIYGTKPMVIAAFVAGIFVIGVLEEIKSLLIIDFVSDNLPSKDRMRISYIQKALGGAATIAIALLLHQLMQGAPSLTRHSMVVGFGALCFVLSALAMMTLQERAPDQSAPVAPRTMSRFDTLKTYWHDAKSLLGEAWFRKFIALRLTFVVAGLSVPFYALIAAEAHHSSAKGLTALVVSSAAALLVAAPLWRALSNYSNRVVMITGALMVAVSGVGLIVIHHWGLDHTVHLHAVSLFVVTVAVTGLGSARALYFMDVAPKSQRIVAQAVSQTISRLSIVAISALLAAIAHMNEVVWAVILITISSLLAVVAILSFVDPAGRPNPERDRTGMAK
ncbi:MFS transporter [uncultured Ruegeria sp.]|uniref:MFS transporter n=1 Tax=uncultured Ruegeria sp. TaxID=259304 RepID=UPI00261B1BB2|nr:MFS transporter [uncultured Ruegeria sp.]